MGASAASSGFAASLLSAPTFDDAQVATAGDAVDLIQLDDPADGSTDTTPWSAQINGTNTAVTNVQFTVGGGVRVELGDGISSGDTVSVTYNPPPYTLRDSVTGAVYTEQTLSATAP